MCVSTSVAVGIVLSVCVSTSLSVGIVLSVCVCVSICLSMSLRLCVCRYCPQCKVDTSEVVLAGEKLKESKKKGKMVSSQSATSRDWGKVVVVNS